MTDRSSYELGSAIIVYTGSVPLMGISLLALLVGIYKQFKNRQPLASRGPYALVACVVYIVVCMLLIAKEASRNANVTYNAPTCFINVFVLLPALFIMFCLYFNATFRYLVLQRLEVAKANIQQQISKEQHMLTYALLYEEDATSNAIISRTRSFKHAKRRDTKFSNDQQQTSDSSSYVKPSQKSKSFFFTSLSSTSRSSLEKDMHGSTRAPAGILPKASINGDPSTHGVEEEEEKGGVDNETPEGEYEVDNGLTQLQRTKTLARLKKSVQMSRVFKIARFLTGNIASMIIIIAGVLIYYGVVLGAMFMSLARSPRVVCSGLQFIATILFAIYIVVMESLFILLLYIDFTGNLAILCCRRDGLKKFFIRDDPFYFRLEFLFMFIISLVYIFAIVLGYVSTDSDADWIWLESLILYALLFTVSFVLPGFPLIMTIIWDIQLMKIKQQHEKEEFKAKLILATKSEIKDNTTLMILKCKETLEQFKKFSRKEFSIENVLFWEDIQKYKKISKPSYHEKRYKYAKTLYDTYLDSGAVLEINIDKRPKLNIKSAFSEYESSKKDVGVDLFNVCEYQCEVNMADIVSRFFRSSEFRDFLKNRDV